MLAKLKRRHGFTLIELAIVIAVVPLLLAILLSVLGRARRQAARQVCNSNLHQLELALRMYHQENNDHFPVVSFLPSVARDPVFIADVLARGVGGQAHVFHCPVDIPGRTERDPPNTGKSYFQTERSSYGYPNDGFELHHYPGLSGLHQ